MSSFLVLLAALSAGYALLGALAWLVDGHRPRNRRRTLRRIAVISTRHDPQPRPADVRRRLHRRAPLYRRTY